MQGASWYMAYPWNLAPKTQDNSKMAIQHCWRKRKKWSLTINPYKIRLSGDRRKIGKGEGHHLTSGGISSTVVELTGRTHTCSLGLSRGRSRQYTFNSKHHDQRLTVYVVSILLFSFSFIRLISTYRRKIYLDAAYTNAAAVWKQNLGLLAMAFL